MRTGAVWSLRVLWFLLPLTVGVAASDAIASASHAVPQVATVGLWILWALGMAASVVPLPLTLTALRVLAPGVLLVATWAIVDTSLTVIAIVGVVHAVMVVTAAFNQLVGDRFVDGGSYGDERRMLLRSPSQLAYGVMPVLWIIMAAGLALGPLLLGDRRWISGAIATIVGIAVVAVGGRALHQLAQRWIVFVPNGMVLHDLTVLTEPVLFRRTAIERLGAAIAGTPARDLSRSAAGLLLECELTDPAPLGLREPGRPAAAATLTDVRRFLFAPTRPGALLDEAERRSIAVD